jgi:ABC-type uncharacterized transport system auxiliary subunit
MKNIFTLATVAIALSGCAANFASDEIVVLSENQNTVTVLGWGNQRVLNVADTACKKYGKTARQVKSWGGTRIERSQWQFDCV